MMQTVQFMRRLRDEGVFLFIITHDYELVAEACDAVIHMDNGGVKEQYPLDGAGIAKLKCFFGVGEP
jgi:energy-coupling factor transport system ATP-binding protein